MPGALLGAASCGRCAAPAASDAARCPRCGAAYAPAASGAALAAHAGLLSGVHPAGATRRRVTLLLDALPVALVAVAVVAVLADGLTGDGVRWGIVTGLLVGLLAYALAQLALSATRGRTLARVVFGVRTVDDLTGVPVGWRRALRSVPTLGWAPRTITADLARGRDPLDLALDAVPASALRADLSSTPVRERGGDAVTSVAVDLVFDSGERVELTRTLLVGRLPANRAGDEHAVFAWPDLSRSLSKTHALLEWTGQVLWVTDLGSTNGSALVDPDGTRQPLAPGVRGAAAIGWTVQLGDRRVAARAPGTREA